MKPTSTTEEFTIVSAPAPAFDAGNPSADCIADSAGGLTFDLDAPHGTDAAEHWSGALVLRPRGAEDESADVLLPLAPTGDGRLRAVLPSTVALPEGRWDVHVASGEEPPRRLLPGLADLRSLVDRRPGPSTSPLAVRIPYATKHGNLSLRSWLRGPHAEAGDVHVGEGALTVRGTLYRVEEAAAWLAGAAVEARLRRDPAVRVGAPVTVGEDQDRADFSAVLPWAALGEHWRGGTEVWDLWLCQEDGAEVRIARLLDDVADKRHVFVYPARSLSTTGAPAQASPYYTCDNDLSVKVEERPPVG
ncbi:hypothetical protein [Streptomyces sp. NPDC049555]|uniref:hypothetical protein n=1 Tax=Streptomyces sp. NPDC049555 TaxID=3154930 RepID=UPI00344722F8